MNIQRSDTQAEDPYQPFFHSIAHNYATFKMEIWHPVLSDGPQLLIN